MWTVDLRLTDCTHYAHRHGYFESLFKNFDNDSQDHEIPSLQEFAAPSFSTSRQGVREG